MSILINSETRVIFYASLNDKVFFYYQEMLRSGTNIVACINTGGKSNSNEYNLFDVPVFHTVSESIIKKPNTAFIMLHPKYCKDAIMDCINNEIKLIVCVTDGIPIIDMFHIKKNLVDIMMIGPNTPGIISPGISKIGLMPNNVFSKGTVGIVSRSGTLCYEAAYQLTKNGMGQSTCVGIGGDIICGTSMIDIVSLFLNDKETDSILILGEMGGNEEIKLAKFLTNIPYNKKIFALIVGESLPKKECFGHIGTMIFDKNQTVNYKKEHLQKAGVKIIPHLGVIGEYIKNYN